MKKASFHLAPLEIDFDLLDAGNVVYHSNYLTLCDRARSRALLDAGCSFKDLWEAGIALAVVETHSKYLRPISLGDQIIAETSLENYSRATLTVRQKLMRLDSPTESSLPRGFFAEAFSVDKMTVCFDWTVTLASVTLSPLKTTRLPEKLLNALNLAEESS